MIYQFVRLASKGALHLTSSPQVVGLENIPATGGAILAANHYGTGDVFMVPSMISRQMVLPAKAELFRGDRGPRSKFIAWGMKTLGMLPVERTGGRGAVEALRPVLEHLQGGGLLAIFPEGTRSPDGRLYKGKAGVARLALTANVPVIPIAVSGTHIVRGRLGLPRLEQPRMVVGRPLDFSSLHGQASVNRTLRFVTDEIMAAIQELGGFEYVDVYGTRSKYGDLKDVDLSDRVLARPGRGATPPEGWNPGGKA